MSSRSDFASGARDAAPAVPPNVSFGMIFGATAVSVGMSPLAATAMSALVFAGAAQMAAVELIGREATLAVVLATIGLLNLRYVIYSASITPYVRHLPTRWKAVIAYPLFDINYALSVATFEGDASVHRGWYYAGASAVLVGTWVLATLAGALLGAAVARDLGLEFVVPLVFLALLAPMVEDRPGAAAALVGGAVAVLGVELPFNAGLLVAAVCGVAAGAAAAGRTGGAGGGRERDGDTSNPKHSDGEGRR